MTELKDYLFDQGYVKTKLKKTATNHIEIKAKINGVKGRFILDTGASQSCVGTDKIEYFKLNSEASEHKASGAGPTQMDTLLSEKNELAIGKFKQKKLSLVLIDLQHINNALAKQEAEPVDGIIGAEILLKSKAIIDYDKKYLYLLNKKKKK